MEMRRLPDVVRTDRRPRIGSRVGPLAVGRLMRFQVHGRSVGVEIGFVVLGIETDQHVAHNELAEHILDGNEESLVQEVAQFHQAENVGFDLLRRGLLVHLESAPARRTDRHRREAVVVAGDAGCLGNETGVGPLNQRKTGLDGALDGVRAARFENRRAGRRALRAGF